MAATLNRLKNTEVANANPTDQSRKLYDGGGLALLIKPTGAKGWRFKYRFGPYPAVSLAEARDRNAARSYSPRSSWHLQPRTFAPTTQTDDGAMVRLLDICSHNANR